MRARPLLVLAPIFVATSFGGIFFAACGGDDTNGTGPTNAAAHDASLQDGHAADTSTDTPSGQDGAPSDAMSGDAGAVSSLVLLNDLVAVRSSIKVCFAASTSADPGLGDAVDGVPLPTAALIGGGVAPLDVAGLEGKNVRVFVYYETSLASFNLDSATCAELFAQSTLRASGDAGAGDGGVVDAGAGSGSLVQTADFDVSDIIPAGYLDSAHRYILLPTGCPLNTDLAYIQTQKYCGLKNDAGVSPFLGDFHVWAYQLDSTASTTPGDTRVQGLSGFQYELYADITGSPRPVITDFGFTYPDSGVVDASAPPGPLVIGPGSDAGGAMGGQSFNIPTANVPLTPGTDVPSIANANAVFVYYEAPGDFANSDLTQDMDTVLGLSGLTRTDLASGAFTLVGYGDPYQYLQNTDGGANAQFNFRIIANTPK